MYRIVIILLSFFCATLSAEEEEIRVYLETQSPLTPLYIGRIQNEAAAFDNSYLEQLNALLRFDFAHDGFSTLLATSEPKEQILEQKDPSSAFNVQSWQNMHAAYVIKPAVSGNKLSLLVFSVASCSLKHFTDITLSGTLNKDRREIHKASDAVHRAIFNTPGVASTRILYSLQSKDAKGKLTGEIWECDWDGGNAKPITKEGSYCVTPVFFPSKGDRFLYVSYKLSQPKIHIATLHEGVGRRFLDLKGNQLLPAISPTGDKIAFICDATGRTDLFVQSFDPVRGTLEKPVQLFSYPRSTQASPTFSPDGSKIAFVSDKDGSPRIYVIPAKTGPKRATPLLLTKQNKESSCPSWSPDGKKLAYSAKTKGIRQIWIYDFSAGEERQLTDGPGNKENPCWGKDSLHLVFNSTDADSSEIYLVNLNQKEAVKITKGSGKKHYPNWK